MSTKQIGYSKYVVGIALAAFGYALPASAVTCPPGEMPGNGEGAAVCVKRDQPKPQLDTSKYAGAQKTEAEACNRANAAQTVVIESSNEISRINTSLNEAHHHVKKPHQGDTPEAGKAEVKRWKALRATEESKLKQAQKDLNAAKKELRAATKAVKKEGGQSLACF